MGNGARERGDQGDPVYTGGEFLFTVRPANPAPVAAPAPPRFRSTLYAPTEEDRVRMARDRARNGPFSAVGGDF